MLHEPLFFERNRVGRIYTGGKLFAGLFGDEPQDGFEPEEWIASRVHAINKVSKGPHEGVSQIQGSTLYFDELLEQYPAELLGEGKSLRILVKVLDSVIRLPAQAHPDKLFSRKNFDSDYGKTECWLMLDTRPDAKLFFGFRDGVTLDDLQRAVDASEYDPDAMEKLMNAIVPQKNEVYFVPARTVHAIGKDCLILEIQEPTDFTIQPERYCGDYRLSDEEMYLGLDRSTALDCFDFGKTPQPLIIPRTIRSDGDVTVENLVGPENTDCFIINRIRTRSGHYCINVQGSYAICIVTEGNGELRGEGYTRGIRKGDYFFMPACAMGKYTATGTLELIECY